MAPDCLQNESLNAFKLPYQVYILEGQFCYQFGKGEKEREGGGERERESRHGRGHGSLCKNPITLFSKGAYIP